MWDCDWWILYKTTTCVKEHLTEPFTYKRSLREERLLEQTRSVKLFVYGDCDIEVPEELKKNFANFPLNSKNTNVGRQDIGLLMKDFAVKEGLLCQPRRMLISEKMFENGTLITPFFLIFSNLGLVCKRFVASWNIFQLIISINLCNLLSMPVEKERSIQTQVLLRKRRKCLPTAPTVNNLWIVVATLSQTVWAMRKHIGLPTQNCSSVRITSMINCMK